MAKVLDITLLLDIQKILELRSLEEKKSLLEKLNLNEITVISLPGCKLTERRLLLFFIQLNSCLRFYLDIEVIDLSHNNIVEMKTIMAIFKICNMEALNVLDLSHNKLRIGVSDADKEVLFNFGKALAESELQKLYIGSCDLDHNNLIDMLNFLGAINNSRLPNTLTHLDLSNNKINNFKGMKIILFKLFEAFPDLNKIVLDGNAINQNPNDTEEDKKELIAKLAKMSKEASITICIKECCLAKNIEEAILQLQKGKLEEFDGIEKKKINPRIKRKLKIKEEEVEPTAESHLIQKNDPAIINYGANDNNNLWGGGIPPPINNNLLWNRFQHNYGRFISWVAHEPLFFKLFCQPHRSNPRIAKVTTRYYFADGFSFAARTLLPTALFGFILLDIFSYYQFPDERYGNTMDKIWLGTSTNQRAWSSFLENSFFTDDVAWITPTNMTYWSIPIFLTLLPFVAGSFEVFSHHFLRRHFSLQLPILDENEHDEIRNIELDLKNGPNYAPNWAKRFLPNVDAYYKISQIKHRILWDDEYDYEEIVKRLINLNSKYGKLARLVLLSNLMEIAYKLGCKKNEKDQRLFLLICAVIKQTGKGGNFYARYLYWSLGSPKRSINDHKYLEILSSVMFGSVFLLFLFGSKIWQFYSFERWVQLWVLKAIDTASFIKNKNECEAQHKVWTYLPVVAKYDCSICGDWTEVYYKNIFEGQSCLDDVLRIPQRPGVLNAKLNRLQPFNITHVDFNHQEWHLWSDGDWHQSLLQLRALIKGSLDYLYLNRIDPILQPISLDKSQNLIDFLNQILVKRLNLANNYFPQNTTSEIIQSAATEIEFLDLNNVRPVADEICILSEVLSKLNRLSQLNLANNQLSSDAMTCLNQAFEQLNLTSLILSGNNVDEIGIQILSQNRFHYLNYLDLSNLPLADANLTALSILMKNPILETLVIQNSQIGDFNLQDFISSLSSSNIKKFDISNNQLTAVSAPLLGVGLVNSSVTSIDFSGNDLSDQGIAILSGYLPNCTLKHFIAADNGIGDLGIRYFSLNLPASNITHIDVSKNLITPIGMSYLAPSLEQMQIISLNISNNPLQDVGLNYLISQNTLFQNYLKRLDISHTLIQNVEDLFVTLSNSSQVEEINLEGNYFVEQEYIDAVKMLADTQIRHLNLKNTLASPHVMDSLKDSLSKSKMATLILSDNQLNDQAIINFAYALIKPTPKFQNLDALRISRDEIYFINDAKNNAALTHLQLDHINISTSAATAICRVLRSTKISIEQLSMNDNLINQEIIDLNSCYISSGYRLNPPYFYVFTYQVLKMFSVPKFLDSEMASHLFKNQFSIQNSSTTAIVCSKDQTSLKCQMFVRNETSASNFIQVFQTIYLQQNQTSLFSDSISLFLMPILFAFRNEIFNFIKPHTPQWIRNFSAQFFGNKENLFIKEIAGLGLRWKYSGAQTIMHDATFIVKETVEHHRTDRSKSYFSIYKEAGKGLLTLGGVYGVAYAVSSLTSNPLIGYLTLPILFNAKQIYRKTSASYKHHGFFSAVDSAVEEIAFSMPGGAFLRQSLAENKIS